VWAAHWWTRDPDLAATYAEEWQAGIAGQPGKLIKLLTAFCFVGSAFASGVAARVWEVVRRRPVVLLSVGALFTVAVAGWTTAVDKQATVAQAYASLSGTIAGWAFAGLVFYLGRPGSMVTAASGLHVEPGSGSGSASRVFVRVLFYPTVPLMICSFLFAGLADDGSGGASGRTMLALLCYGIVFGVSVLALFYALILIMSEHAATRPAARYGYWLVVVAGPAIVIDSLASIARAAWQLRCADHCTSSPWISPTSVGCVLLVGLQATVLLFTWIDWPDNGFVGRVKARLRDQLLLPSKSVWGTTIAVLPLSLWIMTRPPSFKPPHLMIYGILAAGSILLAFFSFACGCVLGSGGGKHRRQPSTS
jgi:hypothetical protein